MKRISATVSLLLAAVVALPNGAQAARGETEFQTVSGNIKMFTRFTDGEGGFPGAGRRLWNVAHETNGLISYTFAVDRETWMGRFELSVTGESGIGDPADLGVYLYEEMADAGNSPAVTTAEYEVRKPGGETGFIPPETRYAIVFMSRGIDVNFTYKGFTPMSAEVSEAGYAPSEVTVSAGGYVVWENAGQDFHSVSATGGSFESSPTLKRPLRPGDAFAVQFPAEGDFAYFDRFSTATGVVHVVPGPGPGTPA